MDGRAKGRAEVFQRKSTKQRETFGGSSSVRVASEEPMGWCDNVQAQQTSTPFSRLLYNQDMALSVHSSLSVWTQDGMYFNADHGMR